eukprot:7897538-Pyramimonas_sp.AAC.1
MKCGPHWRSAATCRHSPLLASAASAETRGAADCQELSGTPRSAVTGSPRTGPATLTWVAPRGM